MKDYMTVKGVEKKEGESLFRDWEKDTDYGIIYYVDKKNKFLMRQILPIKQDVELIRKTRKQMAKQQPLIFIKKDVNSIKLKTADEVLPPETDEELMKLIEIANPKNNELSSVSVAVFNTVTKEFIAALDIEPIPGTDYQAGAITFMFSNNLIIKRRYEQKLKHWINSLLIEKGLYPKGCKEAIWTGEEYRLIPIS